MPASLAPHSPLPSVLPNAPFDPLMARLLCCPACSDRPSLALRAGTENALVCGVCGRVYSIKNGVPYLFMDDADSDPGNEESRARF